jgi:hypothetical protein
MWRESLLLASAALVGCGSAQSGEGARVVDGGSDVGYDAGFGPTPPAYVDGGGSLDASWAMAEGGYVVPEAGVIPADRFITKVVSYSLGPCSGFGQKQMPQIVEGPPVGGGAEMGSTDVLSLGNGGQIIVSFEPNAIVDGPGVDFIVFENPFYIGGNPDDVYAEPGEVSVSEDGVNWTSYPCPDTTNNPPYQQCAGVHPVYSNPDNGISPIDPATAGGDPYDLATIGVKQAKYVRIVDKVIESCPDSGVRLDTNGFDLDAIAVVNAALP